jgi:sugar phosphate isomerase/epimerase
MKVCGDYAARMNVQLAVENHFGTMTTTAKETMKVIEAIDHPNVGVLYDQANLAFFPAEEYSEAIPLQIDVIKYVHVKDLVYKEGAPKRLVADAVSHISEDSRTVISKIPGDGILDWPAILTCLKDNGYNGWLSLEYERRWGNQNLPIASEGLTIAVKRLRQWMSDVEA